MASSTVAMAGIFSSTTTPSSLNTASPSPSPSPASSFRPPTTVAPIRASASAQSDQSSSSSSSSSSSRRSLLSLLAVSAPALFIAKEALAEASSIKLGGPPPLSGGLPGTDSADQARDLDLPLKSRFYLQPLSPAEAIARAKESAKDIVAVKALIDKKAWPYVQNDLRLKASYLRFDLNTIVASKAKEEKKELKALIAKLYDDINNLDFAARSKSVPKAEQYYATTVSSLNDVLAKIG